MCCDLKFVWLLFPKPRWPAGKVTENCQKNFTQPQVDNHPAWVEWRVLTAASFRLQSEAGGVAWKMQQIARQTSCRQSRNIALGWDVLSWVWVSSSSTGARRAGLLRGEKHLWKLSRETQVSSESQLNIKLTIARRLVRPSPCLPFFVSHEWTESRSEWRRKTSENCVSTQVMRNQAPLEDRNLLNLHSIESVGGFLSCQKIREKIAWETLNCRRNHHPITSSPSSSFNNLFMDLNMTHFTYSAFCLFMTFIHVTGSLQPEEALQRRLIRLHSSPKTSSNFALILYTPATCDVSRAEETSIWEIIWGEMMNRKLKVNFPFCVCRFGSGNSSIHEWFTRSHRYLEFPTRVILSERLPLPLPLLLLYSFSHLHETRAGFIFHQLVSHVYVRLWRLRLWKETHEIVLTFFFFSSFRWNLKTLISSENSKRRGISRGYETQHKPTPNKLELSDLLQCREDSFSFYINSSSLEASRFYFVQSESLSHLCRKKTVWVFHIN